MQPLIRTSINTNPVNSPLLLTVTIHFTPLLDFSRSRLLSASLYIEMNGTIEISLLSVT